MRYEMLHMTWVMVVSVGLCEERKATTIEALTDTPVIGAGAKRRWKLRE